jgi:hypothetical protein
MRRSHSTGGAACLGGNACRQQSDLLFRTAWPRHLGRAVVLKLFILHVAFGAFRVHVEIVRSITVAPVHDGGCLCLRGR